MARIVILGGGFGGLAVAHGLWPAIAQGHTVTLIDRRERFRMGLAKLWVLVGKRGDDQGWGELRRLAEHGVRFVHADVQAIDVVAKAVRSSVGDEPYEYLVIAVGADARADALPGLPPAANLYDPASVPGLAERLAAIRQGTVAIAVCASPYKCPPAPFEAAMLVDEALRARGVRGSVAVTVSIPDPEPMPVAGPAAGRLVRSLLAERGITLRSSCKPAAVDVGALVVPEQEPLPFDLLLAVPPHCVPRVVVDAGLTDATGWIPVDPQTLATRHEGVFAIGDVAGIKLPGAGMLPKAGVLAQGQGEVVAANLVTALSGGRGEASFDGRGECFIEVGAGNAIVARGAFYQPPGDRVEAELPASPAGLAAKHAFESERLARWF